jgi:hypothetical protein
MFAIAAIGRHVLGGGDAVLLRKQAVVEPGGERLPVFTLTFRTPREGRPVGVAIDLGGVLKVLIPGAPGRG